MILWFDVRPGTRPVEVVYRQPMAILYHGFGVLSTPPFESFFRRTPIEGQKSPKFREKFVGKNFYSRGVFAVLI